MIHLVTGGSGSGKSEYAENWLTGRNKKDGTYIYIATMQPYTEETMKKIERHHRLRAGKGFRTLEKYTDLSELEIPKNQGILLECISNLVANELYREDGTLNDLKETKEKVLAGVRRHGKISGMHRNGESKSCRVCRYSNGSCVWNSGMHS